MAEPSAGAQTLAALFEGRRADLEATQRASRTKTAAVVAEAHLDELNLLHDVLAGLGLLPERERADETFAPHDPAAHLRPAERN